MEANRGNIALPILRNLENHSPELIGIMGIIKNIIGAVLGLLAAIGGLVGIGGKSDNGYFLDLSEGQGGAATPAKVAAAPAAKAPTAQAAPAAVAPVEKVAAKAPAASADNDAAASAKAAKAAIKSEKAAAKVAATEAAAATKVAEADSAAAAEKEAIATMTFSDVMMVPSNTMSKRSPGPSLAGFQEMAKEMASNR